MFKRQIKFISIIITVVVSGLLSLPMMANGGASKDFTVVIDPGHGGKDFGAVDNGTKEKEINLSVALQLKKLIDNKLKGTSVVMTRKDDTYLTLQQRADIANKAKGDLFISIHTNSVDKSNKNRKNIAGSSVYALGLHKDDNNMAVARRENAVIELESNYEQKYSGFDPSKDESYIIFEMAQKKNLNKSIKFADLAQKELVKSGRKNRGVHQAGFWVLWATSMPSVLVELDFICNPDAAKYLSSEKGAQELAQAIFNAVEAYEKDYRVTHSLGNHSAAKTRSGAADGNAPKVVASSKASVKKGDKAPADNTTRTTVGKRRRRSERGRESSISRNVETRDIPMHSSTERLGKTVEGNDSEELIADASADSQNAADKKGKKDKKKGKQNKKETKKKERPANSHNAKVEKVVTVYRIQVLASTELLKQNNPRFRGLSPITATKEGNYYKYYYGESENQKDLADKLAEVKKLIPDAFIVSIKKSKKSK